VVTNERAWTKTARRGPGEFRACPAQVMLEMAFRGGPTGLAWVFLLGFVRIAARAGAVPKDAGLAKRCGS
jgi:hypothetical protein